MKSEKKPVLSEKKPVLCDLIPVLLNKTKINKDVRLSNIIVFSKLNLNLNEMRLFLFALKNENNFISDIHYKDFCQEFRLKRNSSYHLYKSAARNILKKEFLFLNDDEDYIAFNIFSYVRYHRGFIQIKFSSDVKEIINPLSHFFIVNLSMIANFKSLSDIKLYLYLKSQYHKTDIDINFHEFQTYLGTNYKKKSDFARFVLKPGLQVLNTSDISFRIKRSYSDNIRLSIVRSDLKSILMTVFKMKAAEAKELINYCQLTYNENFNTYFAECVSNLKDLIKTRDIKNISRYAYEYIKNDWRPKSSKAIKKEIEKKSDIKSDKERKNREEKNKKTDDDMNSIIENLSEEKFEKIINDIISDNSAIHSDFAKQTRRKKYNKNEISMTLKLEILKRLRNVS